MPQLLPPLQGRHRASAAKVVFALLLGGVFAAEMMALFVRESGMAETERGDRPRLVGEVAGPKGLVQTFTVGADGFSGVTVEARPYHETVTGNVVFTLQALADPDDPALGEGSEGEVASPIAARVVKPADEVAGSSTFRVEFSPIEDSSGRRFLLRIQAPDTPVGRGLGFWATREQTYRGGRLVVGGAEQWGDLVFRTHASRATLFPRIEHSLRNKPAWLRSRWMLGAFFLLYNGVLAVFAWYMLLASDELGPKAQKRAA